MPGTLGEMLGGALAAPQMPPTLDQAPLLNVDRSRFPPGMLEALGLGGAQAPGQEYFTDPLLEDRSRFPAGMLESLGLGAARR
jgi:hypothetical protein